MKLGQIRRALAIIAVALLWMNASPLFAQAYTVLHNFTNFDGAQPYAGIIASGNALFSTTKFGGTTGNGTVFTVNNDGTGFNVLHSFTYSDGGDITSDLSLSGGILYGAAYQGGSGIQQGGIFSIGEGGSGFKDDYIFTGGQDGDAPRGGLLLSGGLLYGTTSTGITGGVDTDGTVFSIDTNGANLTVLHTFTGPDGNQPEGDLIMDNGVLYGTTYNGGVSGLGTIFSVQANGSNFAVLHSFSGSDGTQPLGGLVLAGGVLYGTASAGGQNSAGTIFSIQTNGGNFSALYSFVSGASSIDGQNPSAALCLAGNLLYGTTANGGTASSGTIFSIDTSGNNYTQVFSFDDSELTGANPSAPLLFLGNSLYGTTIDGGAGQNGTIFRLQVQGIVFSFEPSGAINVPIGGGAFFGAGGESLSNPSATIQYQWRLNGVNIPGATSQGIGFGDVQATNGGSVTMTISDGTNALTSPPVGFSVAISTIASSNDNFSSRFQLGTAFGGVVKSSNINATKEVGEPEIIAGNPGGKSVWFRWQPAGTGTAVFDTQGSDFDTMMGVYTGSNIASLARVPSAVNDDDEGGYLTSQVTFNCVAGTFYNIVVDGYWGASGNIVLSWTNQSFPHSLPTIFQTPPRQTVVSNGAAVTFVCKTTNGSISWLFNGQPTGVTGTNYLISSVDDTNVGTYVAEVTAGSGVTFTEPAHLQISLLEDGTSDTNSVAWNKFLDSSSAAYTNPAVSFLHKLGGSDTRGYSVAQTFSTVGATGEPGEPSIAGQIGNSPVWYTWVTPTNGAILINTAGSSFNTMLGVFVGNSSSFATLTNIGEGYTTDRTQNGQPQVFVPGEPKGVTNFIVVDGYKNSSGTVRLNISMGDPITINTPPQNLFGAIGGNVTFTVSADGSTPVFYNWEVNGTNIAGATTSALTILDVQPSNAGLYTVSVSNSVSETSSSATLSVGTAPTITAEPSPVVQLVGSTATFTVGASGNPVLSYQWYTNNVAVSGATSSSLTFTSLTANQDGTIVSATVNNNYGTAASSGALLTVQVPIPPSNVTIGPPLVETILAGGTAVFSVSASGPGLTYYWQHNGVPLADGGSVSGSSTSVLTINNVFGIYSGTYTVTASNAFGALPANNSATLTVIDPYITTEPLGSTNLPNTSPVLSVSAIGTQTLTYQWLSNGVPVAGANANTFTVANSGQTASAGYSVIVSNGLGNAVTSSVAPVSFTSVLLSDTFSYPDGNLFSLLGSPWTEIGGSNPELNDGLRAQINESNAYTTALSLFSTQETGTVLWASFIVNVGVLPDNPGGVCFATFDDALYGLYGRIFVLTSNSPNMTPNISPVAFPGTYRLGIANTQGDSSSSAFTGPSAVVPMDLAPGIDYQLVCYLDLVGDVSGMAINPAALNDVKAIDPGGVGSGTATDTFTPINPFAGFVLRQGRGEGVMEMDNLIVSFDWNGPGSGYPVVTEGIAPATPVIGLQPVGTTNNEGSSYLMEVAASGIGTAGAGLAYAWFQNGAPLIDGGSITGSATAALTINPLSPTNSGAYYVVVTGAGGSVRSSTAMIQVNVPATPPVFVIEPAPNTTVSQGGTATFDSLAIGTGPIAYAWYFSSPFGVNQLGGDTNSDLTITGLTTNESGTYYVIATGDNGAFQTQSTDAILTVLAPILPPPLATVGNLGASLGGAGAGGVTLTWTAVPNNYTYSVWFTSDLSQPFANLVSGLIFTNTVGTYTDPGQTTATKFYEISSP